VPTTSFDPQGGDSIGVSTLTRFLTTSFDPQGGNSHGVPGTDQAVSELVRVLDTPLPLEMVVVNKSEQVSVVSNLPISEVNTTVIGRS